MTDPQIAAWKSDLEAAAYWPPSEPEPVVPLEAARAICEASVREVTCKFCNGIGSVPDISKWPPQAVCPGCKGAGVHHV